MVIKFCVNTHLSDGEKCEFAYGIAINMNNIFD